MHTSDDLRSADFDITIAARPATLADLFPGFTEHDRLGVVVRSPFGATGASTLILAAITAFYDLQRAKHTDYFLYPDYFLLHVDNDHGDHNMLDIYPDHKELVVPNDAEHLLQAINDQAITRLLVPDGSSTSPAFQPETLGGAERRLTTALAYSPTGRVPNADVTITGTAITERYVREVLHPHVDALAVTDVEKPVRARPPADVGAALLRARATLLTEQRPLESFRRISIPEALRLLVP